MQFIFNLPLLPDANEVVKCFRWNRLENLLVQGKKDRDFSAKDALQPVLKLILAPDGEALRVLVVKEAVRVTEAIIVGTLVESYNSAPAFVRTLISSGNASGPFTMSTAEQESMMELRAHVFRIWELLRTSQSFDPALLQPILQVRTVLLIIQVSSPFTVQEKSQDVNFHE